MEKYCNKSVYIKFTAWLAIVLAVSACKSPEEKEFPESFKVTVTNPVSIARSADFVSITPDQLPADFNSKSFIVLVNGKEMPSQYNQHDTDFPGIAFVIDSLSSNEVREFVVRYNPIGESSRNYARRTQAELSHKTGGEWKEREYIGGDFKNVDFLRVPPEHKDHSWFIRYEGPGWESDKVGYRFYLDQRNAVDVFGKAVPEPVLQKAGLDGFDSYHELQDWGMDVLKVAKSLGVGSIGYLRDSSAVRVEVTDSVTCRIVENGAVYSSIHTNYYGWDTGVGKTNLSSRLSIHGGTRVTQQKIDQSQSLDNICSGLIKDAKASVFKKDADAQSLGYISTYGKQSLNNDNLGIAVLFSADNFQQFTEDEFSHIVKLKPTGNKLTYYFVAAWEGEPGGIKTEAEFQSYLEQIASTLAAPVRVEVVK